MGSYDSMKSKLEPIGVYSLAPGDITDCELKAYACGLDPLFDKLEEFEREGFIATAESYGLSEREKFLDREKPGLTTARRRELLIALEQSLGMKATPSEFLEYLQNCGLEQVTISEYPTRQRLSVFIDDDLNAGQKRLIVKKTAAAAPAHLNVMIHFHDGSQENV